MIYSLNSYGENPIYFVEQAIYDANPNYKLATLVVGTKADAEIALINMQTKVLNAEASRFSVCATFVEGNNTIWREVQDSDVEDTICQVFDTFTGTYTQVNNKTEAYELNEQKKQNFLIYYGLDKIYNIDNLPPQPTLSKYPEVRYGLLAGDIPVEVM